MLDARPKGWDVRHTSPSPIANRSGLQSALGPGFPEGFAEVEGKPLTLDISGAKAWTEASLPLRPGNLSRLRSHAQGQVETIDDEKRELKKVKKVTPGKPLLTNGQVNHRTISRTEGRYSVWFYGAASVKTMSG